MNKPAAKRPRVSVSKKWQSHFFEKAALRYAPYISAVHGRNDDARYARRIFPTYTPPEK